MTQSDDIQVAVVPHPFSTARRVMFFPPGSSLADIVARAQPDPVLRRHAHVEIGGESVAPEAWARVRPKPGLQVAVRMVPMGGGGGKNPLRTVLTLAIAAAAPAVGGFFATGIFAGGGVMTAVGSALSAGVSFAAQLALNALAPPARSRFQGVKESQTLFIQGAQNRAQPFARVPRVLGAHRMVPPLGAIPYTETQGNEQYLRMLFVWGYGPLEISDLKIGETPLSSFEGVEIETRQGYPADAPLTLYSNSVLQNDLQVALTAAGGPVMRVTDADADEFSVDVTFPRGLFILTSKGAKAVATVAVEIAYRPVGGTSWTEQTFTWSAAQGAALRQSARFRVAKGAYEVRLRRVTPDTASDSVFDEAVWTALRTVRSVYPVRRSGLAVTALRIKASDQLSGVIDRFNGVVRAIIPDYDGGAWTPRATSNPASIFRHVLQGGANARPLADGRIDLVRLEAWHAACAAKGREFNAVIDYDVSVREVLQAACAAGRASPCIVDGKWSVVEDKPQDAPVQHFTPRNTWGFSGERAFTDAPHALRVRFINRDKGWLQDEVVVYDDGRGPETAERYDVLELSGVTAAAQAWQAGRYHIATARLRPETYSFMADVEHIVCTRGDLIRFTHDVPLFGLQSARVKSLGGTGSLIESAVLDADVEMQDGKAYAARFRRADGSTVLAPLVTVAGTGTALTFAPPLPEGAGPAAGDLVLFGEAGRESVELIVKEIEPRGDLSARIVCVDAAPAIHAAGDGVIPPFSSQATVPPEMQRPPQPAVVSVQPGIDSKGAFVVVTLAPPAFHRPLVPRIRARRAGESAFHPVSAALSGPQIVIAGLETGALYDFKIFYEAAGGVASPFVLVTNAAAGVSSSPPPDVQGFAVNIAGETAYLSWQAVPGDSIAGYKIRFSDSTAGASWAAAYVAGEVPSRDVLALALPARPGTWLIKAVTVDGRESAVAATAVSGLARDDSFVPRLTVDETPHFAGPLGSPAGTSSGVALTGDHRLVLAPGVLEGTYYFGEQVDLGGVYAVAAVPSIVVAGYNAALQVDAWSSIDLVEEWDGTADPATWDVRIQMRTTSDPVAGTPSWSAWKDLTVGAAEARGFQFRIVLSSSVEGVTPSVSLLSVALYMKVRSQSARNLSGGAADEMPGGGTRVSYPDAFYDPAAVAVTPHNMGTGDRYEITGKDAQGFNIRFYNAGGARVTRAFDYIAQGTGRKAVS